MKIFKKHSVKKRTIEIRKIEGTALINVNDRQTVSSSTPKHHLKAKKLSIQQKSFLKSSMQDQPGTLGKKLSVHLYG